jgi:DNA polymerase eta
MGVLQWNMLVAVNYVAKAKGVKRGMQWHEALNICPDFVFVHVATIIDNTGNSKS